MSGGARFFFFSLFAAAVLAPAGAVERSLRRTFTMLPGSALSVDTYRGGVIVEESKDNELRVEVRIDLGTDDEAEAERGLGALKLAVDQTGNEVRVRARNPRESFAIFAWEEKKRTELTFRVFVPKGCRVDVRTLDGGITVGNRTGDLTARTQMGTIFCRAIDGSIQATIDAGDIIVSRCTGTANLKVQRGVIRVGTIFGRAELRNDSGDIEIQSALGGVSVAGSAGDVLIGFQRGLSGDSTVKADGGSIVAKIEPTAAISVEATTTWGKVQSGLPFALDAGGVGKSKYFGRLNGGGPLVKLHASGGNVKLEPYQQFLELNTEF
jgi:DUF4097 and DUF4098 domain-containing protein YvlB